MRISDWSSDVCSSDLMSTPETTTREEVQLNLTPPDPVPAVAPEKAAGLVPVSEENRSKLDAKVDAFVADLVAEDTNSPAFGERSEERRVGKEVVRTFRSRGSASH